MRLIVETWWKQSTITDKRMVMNKTAIYKAMAGEPVSCPICMCSVVRPTVTKCAHLVSYFAVVVVVVVVVVLPPLCCLVLMLVLHAVMVCRSSL